jgi:thiol-disulfide isomerase/thioredoxin
MTLRVAATLLLLVMSRPASSAVAGQPAEAPASAAPLSVGDAAPPLSIEQWIRGDPIQRLLPGTVYVLDFSAPWCAPCMAMLPHMSMLQGRFAAQGVRFVAVFGPDSAGTSPEQVKTLFGAWREPEPAHFAVAYDARGNRSEPALDMFYGRTAAAYLEGAGLDGIPAVFVVDRQGRVAWIGQPAQVAAVVEQVVAGAWDLQSAGERYRAARAADERLLRFKADLDAGRVAAAMAEAKRLAEGPYAEDSGALRVIASAIAAAAQAGAAGLDLRLAVSAIVRAEALTLGTDATVLTTLARLLYLQGELPQAIEAQQRAIRVAQESQRPMLQKTLDEYVLANTTVHQ